MSGYFAEYVSEEERDDNDLDDFDVEAPDVVAREGGGTSPRMEAYFQDLERRMRIEYQIAEQCRSLGLDPETHVEIPPATDLAARCEELMKDYLPERGVAERIRELSKEKNREETALLVAKEAAAGRFGKFDDIEKAVDGAVRIGLAILTEGILVAPLEGIAGVRVLDNADGTDCVAVAFAGPIRAAGGTGQALSVLIADVVRRELGIGKYLPTEQEIMRLKEEIPAYKMAANLQYTPSADEIDLIMRNCPIMVDGEGTERDEVGGNRDLPRIETNQIRGGACLVIAEGLTLKAPKIQKHVKNLGLEGWDFIDTFVNKGKKDDAGQQDGDAAGGKAPTRPAIDPNPKYMADIIAGRPVFSHPSRPGGWRLRYGRARTGGLATLAVHPAAMTLVDDFLAVGTQMKIERPGKATVATPCDTIEPPLVVLHNGSLRALATVAAVHENRTRIKRVVDLGEILVPFGEFVENNKQLPQAAYCAEWWEQEVEKAGAAPQLFATAAHAFDFAAQTGTPLHPAFNLFWHDTTPHEMAALRAFLVDHATWAGDRETGTFTVPRKAADADPAAGGIPAKTVLERLGALHEADEETVTLDVRYAYAVVRAVGLDVVDGQLKRAARDAPAREDDPVAVASALAGVTIRARGPHRIGTRMGRPEKAAERKMAPPVHGLFPIGQAGGAQRLIGDAVKLGTIHVEVGQRQCPKCERKTILLRCPACAEEHGGACHTTPVRNAQAVPGRQEPIPIPLNDLVDDAKARIGMDRLPEPVKGVIGLISRSKTPEAIEKVLLRAQHQVFTFKDGTARFDMTDITLTHFKAKEAGVTPERLRELGYERDVKGEPLERDDQVVELNVQDIIVSTACLEYMLKCAQFVDDELRRLYGFKPYYNAKTPDDLIGQLFVALAPHTSGGVLCRVIGHNRALGHFGHPYFHAAKRRNCDGDEDCIMLLLDGLLNFSRSYLPSNRGGLMDAPLTLTMRIDPNEVDKEAHNVDVMWRYPLEFYEATMKHPGPKDVEKLIETVASRLGTPGQYEGIGYTHDTSHIAEGPAASAYKTIGSMMDKMEAQLELAIKLRAVDAPDVAARVIGSHFLPDLMGNLKAFSKQAMRCTKCNAKYRRVPLGGACLKNGCGGNLTMTVYEASVKKYLEVSKQICVKYQVNPYVRQRLEHIEDSIESLFTNDRVKKAKLSDFF